MRITQLSVWCLAMLAAGTAAVAAGQDNRFPGASRVPESQPGWQRFETEADPGAPLDEAQGGRTARGTAVAKRNEHCFPAETRNLFYEVDMVVSGPSGHLEPFDYTDGRGVGEEGREAIRGQNTWILWGEGNEAFWGWLQEQGYGLVDFLVLLDSRNRNTRFTTGGGMINQPGMKAQESQEHELYKLLGLYLDQADGDRIVMKQPPTDVDAQTQRLARRPEPPVPHPTRLFEVGDEAFYRKVVEQLPQDGVDTTIYGYPSGVVGLRLMPNPDFFGVTPEAKEARRYWNERVVRTKDAYYDVKRRDIFGDPSLVRPFRVTMSCGYCHIGPHPLNPPADPNKPAWANLSSVIGNQYWRPPKLFANLTRPDNFLYQFLASQLPGTVDTSLVSTDHINNANTITAVFDVPARLERAKLNPPERQSAANLTFRGLEDGDRKVTPRRTPRVLVDGADSIGVFGALARVYLNIGTFPEEWVRCHNPIIGFKPQRPFSTATLREKSAFWRAGENYRTPYLAKFFTYTSKKTGASITAPMKLAALPAGRAMLEPERALAAQGRDVFLKNCAICHSSKQPGDSGKQPHGFELDFKENWASKAPPKPDEAPRFTLPTRFEEWGAFRESKVFAEYRRRILEEAGRPAGEQDHFIKDNFLSTDIRVPVTLVGTNSGRAVGTNGMRGQVWDNFSSEEYKNLRAVGGVRFYNLYSGTGIDPWGNNDTYYPPGGGPGYYRPASLISLWATAPYLHNNALGLFNNDPSVAGRLEAFNDGIDKLLWRAKRVPSSRDPFGDLRVSNAALARSDPGFIYRATEPSSIVFGARFIRPLLEGMLGSFATKVLTLYLWIALALFWLVLALVPRARIAGFVLLLFAVGAAVVLVITRLDRVWAVLWLAPVLAAAAAVWLWLGTEKRWAARTLFTALTIASIALGVGLTWFVSGRLGDLTLPPFPRGTPVNLIMNMNPEAPRADMIRAVSALTRGLLLSRAKGDSPEALRVFAAEAGAALLAVSKCPDFVLDRGHWFAEGLSDTEKQQLKAFLKTL
jgi:hypothetical protein